MASELDEPRWGIPSAPLRNPGYSTVVYSSRFTDHTGNEALSIWRGFAKPNGLYYDALYSYILTNQNTVAPLRHPFNFQIYVTSGSKATDEGVEAHFRKFYEALHDIRYPTPHYWGIAVYFFPPPWPSSSQRDAIFSHYKMERSSRQGTDWPIPETYKTYTKPYDALVLVVDDEYTWGRDGKVDVNKGGVLECLMFERLASANGEENEDDRSVEIWSCTESLQSAWEILLDTYSENWDSCTVDNPTDYENEFQKRQAEHLKEQGLQPFWKA